MSLCLVGLHTTQAYSMDATTITFRSVSMGTVALVRKICSRGSVRYKECPLGVRLVKGLDLLWIVYRSVPKIIVHCREVSAIEVVRL